MKNSKKKLSLKKQELRLMDNNLKSANGGYGQASGYCYSSDADGKCAGSYTVGGGGGTSYCGY